MYLCNRYSMVKINKGNTNEEYVVVTESTGEENKWKEEEVKSDLPKTIPLPTPNFTRTITTSTTPAIVDDVNNNDEIERDRTHNHLWMCCVASVFWCV